MIQNANNNQTRDFLSRAYKSGIPRTLTKKELNSISKYHKQHYKLSLEDYWNGMPDDVKKNIEAVPSIAGILKKNIEDGKALQSGVLTEAVVTKSVADALGATEMKPVMSNELEELVVDLDIVNFLHGKFIRFAYTHLGRTDLLVAQCGGPASGDTFVFEKGIVYSFEDKEAGAKAGENDCLYDEDGKLIAPDTMPEQAKMLVDAANKLHDSMFDHFIGHNLRYDEETARDAVMRYFQMHKISVYATVDKNGNVILAGVNDLDDLDIFSYEGSEMRMAGRNPKTVFTPKKLAQTLECLGAELSGSGNTTVCSSRLSTAKKRGGTEISRYKLSPLFFVRVENCTVIDGEVSFNLKNVKQLKPTVSPHISFKGAAADISRYYLHKEYVK